MNCIKYFAFMIFLGGALVFGPLLQAAGAVNYTAIPDKQTEKLDKGTHSKTNDAEEEKQCGPQDKKNIRDFMKFHESKKTEMTALTSDPAALEDKGSIRKIVSFLKKYTEFVTDENFEQVKTSFAACDTAIPVAPGDAPFWFSY